MSFHVYCDTDELIQDVLSDQTGDDERETIGRLIESVSAFVDRYTKRPAAYYMPASLTATPRYYVATNRNLLQVGLHVAGSLSIQNIAAGNYEVRDKMIYSIQANGDEYMPGGLFRPGCQYIVTARWGYLETPAEIIEATKQIVARWYSQGRGTLGQSTPDGFILERDMPPNARALLAGFIKNEYELN
jgi:hypothetical protein